MGAHASDQARQRFWRAKPGNGSGLGLTIVDAVVARYEGSLSLGSNAGGGLTVRLTLPRVTGAKHHRR